MSYFCFIQSEKQALNFSLHRNANTKRTPDDASVELEAFTKALRVKEIVVSTKQIEEEALARVVSIAAMK